MQQKNVRKKDLVAFGLIWAAIFLGISIYPFLKERNFDIASLLESSQRTQICLGLSVTFLLVSIIFPRILSPFYKVWIKIGNIIGGVISKVILIILFYLLFTPIALCLRLLRKDLLNKRLDKSAESYWIKREEQPQSLKNQF